MWEIVSNFVAFLENLNFTLLKIKISFKNFHFLLIISLYFLKMHFTISQKTVYNLSKTSL